jgi:O-methyltransferase involved in polyketide biosynthesis
MTITLPAFTPLEESLFLTLCCRALDNRSAQPILGDAMADEIVRELDYDYEALHISADLMLNATLERSASTCRPPLTGTTSTFLRSLPHENA